jgi:hypothetical protein
MKIRREYRQALIAVLFSVFLFLRLFTSSDYIFLDGDEIKYLEMAKNFPHHATFNKQLEINHGPFFPYVIYFFTLIFGKDYLAAIFISLLSASVTFFVVYRLFMMLTNNFLITFVSLIFFSLSVELITASKVGLKESFAVMLMVSAIYYYVHGVKFRSKKSILIASAFGGMTALTVDHVIFLFPTFTLAYVFFNYEKVHFRSFKFPGIKYALLPIIVTFALYAVWTGVKLHQYATNEYYPAGLVGTPVSTQDVGLMEILNPRYFEGYESVLSGGFSLSPKSYAYGLGYMFDITPFTIPRGLNFTTMEHLLLPRHVVFMILFYLPLALVVVFGLIVIFREFARTRRIYNNSLLFVFLTFLIFLFPLTQAGTSLRYFYTSFIFLYFFVGCGLYFFLRRWEKRLESRHQSLLVLATAIILLAIIPYWYYQNYNFVLTNEKFAYAKSTADYINANLDKNAGIMIQPGYIYKLQYQTGARTVGLPPDPEVLMTLIEYYDIDYVIFGKYFTWTKYHYSRDSAEYILSNPDQFELVGTVLEDYESLEVKREMGAKMRASDELYIYRVKRQN